MAHKSRARRAAPKESGDETLVLTVPAAGKLLGISRYSAYAAAGRGQLPVVKFGGRLVVPKVALQRLLETVGKA